MRIVKVGGRTQADPRLTLALKNAWKASPRALCVVHGGGDELSAMQHALGREAAFIGGRRVTSRDDLELLRMVLSGAVNKRLVSALVAAGVPAVGISGEDGALLGAEIIDRATLGFAGRPVTVNADLLRVLMKSGYLPVVSPVGCDLTDSAGSALNVNGDDAAAAIAAALGADELLLIADIEGVRDESGEVASSLGSESASELIASGIARGGMAAKLESAQAALAGGVSCVRICDLEGLNERERGTFITQSQSLAL
jgi:acetylglutamate kinase